LQFIREGGELARTRVGVAPPPRLMCRGEQMTTRDHSLVQDLVDAGMLSPEETLDHPNANVITRAVGAVEELRIETVSAPPYFRMSAMGRKQT